MDESEPIWKKLQATLCYLLKTASILNGTYRCIPKTRQSLWKKYQFYVCILIDHCIFGRQPGSIAPVFSDIYKWRLTNEIHINAWPDGREVENFKIIIHRQVSIVLSTNVNLTFVLHFTKYRHLLVVNSAKCKSLILIILIIEISISLVVKKSLLPRLTFYTIQTQTFISNAY